MLNNHIHISDTIGAGPELAPDMAWKIREHQEIPEVVVNLRRAINGKFRAYVLQDISGPVQFTNYAHRVIVRATDSQTFEQRWADLKALNGTIVYYCPPHHAADGVDHTADVREMFLEILSGPKADPDDVAFQDVIIEIRLTDADTV